MASPYTLGALNAEKLASVFTKDKVRAGAVSIGDAETGVTFSHGLGGTPTFAMAMNLGFAGKGDNAIAATASATEVRFSWADTDAATTSSISYIIGILA